MGLPKPKSGIYKRTQQINLSIKLCELLKLLLLYEFDAKKDTILQSIKLMIGNVSEEAKLNFQNMSYTAFTTLQSMKELDIDKMYDIVDTGEKLVAAGNEDLRILRKISWNWLAKP
jgi:hypothetical protein